MTKIHPSLKQVVDKATRRRLYKAALLYYTQWDDAKPNEIYHCYDDRIRPLGLCILLPCMLWKLNTYMSSNPNTNKSWDHDDTVIAFPEIKRYISQIESTQNTAKNALRIKALNEILANLK